MPVYDARLNNPDWQPRYTTHLPGALPFPAERCLVTDANGVEIPCVRMCNTETGWVERYRLKPGTRVFVTDPLPPHRPILDLECHPAPLRVEVLTDVPMTDAELAEFRRWQAGQRAADVIPVLDEVADLPDGFYEAMSRIPDPPAVVEAPAAPLSESH